MISTPLLNFMFSGFNMQRWNDKIRTVELTEADKHAHKMIIAYCLGKCENGDDLDWTKIINYGIFEYFRRVALSDIKSPVLKEIKSETRLWQRLNNAIWEARLSSLFGSLNSSFGDDLNEYVNFTGSDDSKEAAILEAAHIYASIWEFEIIKRADPCGYEIDKIDNDLKKRFLSYHSQLCGVRKIWERDKLVNFIDLCGRLRFQMRWGQAARLPRTAVLGHMFMVAAFSYLLSKEEQDHLFCEKRLFNNFFGGLFHDLPEAVTRDIVSPVKSKVPQLEEEIKAIEKIMMKKEVYPLLDEHIAKDIRYFTEDEFSNKTMKDGETIPRAETDFYLHYNQEEMSPIDGQLINIADNLAGYLEAKNSTMLLRHLAGDDPVKQGLKSYREKLDPFSHSNKNPHLGGHFLISFDD